MFGAWAVLVVAGCTGPAGGGACSGQPPGCGSAQATAPSLAGFTWSAAPAPPLSPRFAQASLWTGTELLIWGGVTESHQTVAGDGAGYDPATRVWTPLPASPLSPRDTAFAVWTGTRALFWGGGNGSDIPLNDGASYDPAGRTWAMLPAAPLRPVAEQAIVWTGTRLVVIQPAGGAAFTPAANSWTPVPPLPRVKGWPPFEVWAESAGRGVITWVASRPSAVHGLIASGLLVRAFSWRPGSPTWTSVASDPNDADFPFGTAAFLGGRLLFLGGSDCPPGASCPVRTVAGGAWFDPSSGTWTSLPGKFSGGFGPAVWTGSAMVVFATRAGASTGPPDRPPGIPAGAAAAFDPSTGAWTDLARCPIPDLTNASLAWTGRQLIVVTIDAESGHTPRTQVLSPPIPNST